ncbi:MAG: peptidoglycan-binding domain-containing protein [Anaeromyxobacteraceae bacterium]
MRRPQAVAAWLLALACFHTQHVAKSGAEDSGGEGDEAAASGKRAGGSGAPEKGRDAAPSRSRVPARAGRPTVAASPEGLMNPGAIRRIQAALRTKGYLEAESGDLDDPTAAALRRFQADEGIAATGAPDRETLRRLGVDPNEVYRTAP